MVQQEVVLGNATGLHARPATLFVQAAKQFKETAIQLVTETKAVDGKSILGVMSLGAKKGTTLTIRAEGPQEVEALAALVGLVKDNFGEQ
ncbi:MAG TPA: HPr family phosphocarrier protein [Firmicutes bacterium]|nr:HPr family phosphocarrier protein [Bacillota bacterium]